MALNEQEVEQLMLKYTQLKQQAAALMQQLQVAQAPKPKLSSFHGTKLEGKKENFKSWDT
jgi:phage shock protein A